MKKIIQWIARYFGLVVIDYRTAEYLSCLTGHIPWGNPKRRRSACHMLGEAMGALNQRPESKSLECFQEATWDITAKKR